MSAGSIFIAVVSGIIGMGFIAFARRMQNPWYFVSGLGLVIFPYFIDNIFLATGLLIILAALPFVAIKYL